MSTLDVQLSSPHWTKNTDDSLFFWSSDQRYSSFPLSAVTAKDCASLPGQWALIDLRGESPVLISDPIRSHPLLYRYDDVRGVWIVSDHPRTFSALDPAVDSTQAQLFPDFGYSLGSSTLLANVQATEAGSIVRLGKGQARIEKYRPFTKADQLITDRDEFSEQFSDALDTVFTNALEPLRGRQVVIPLSGGLDSRLILLWLRKYGYQNVLTFTYGKEDSVEASISRRVAESLGFAWEFVHYDVKDIRSAWKTHDAASFISDVWSGTSLPHVQDWFALHTMKRREVLDDDAVFLPGHTIVGNMHNEELLEENPATEEIIQALVNHHGNLRGRVSRLYHDPTVLREIRRALQETGYNGSPRSVQSVIEWFNLRERQSKYINNSMKGYEHFGWSWSLPMLDPQIWDVWASGSAELTATRDWYNEFVSAHYAKAAGENTELYAAPSLGPNNAFKHFIVEAIKSGPVDTAIRRIRSTRAMRNHPLAFEAFTPDQPATAQIFQMLKGANLTGIWSEAFLSGTWTESCRKFPPEESHS